MLELSVPLVDICAVICFIFFQKNFHTSFAYENYFTAKQKEQIYHNVFQEKSVDFPETLALRGITMQLTNYVI